MSNGFFGSNDPQRESERRMSDERNRDFGGAAPSRGPEQGAGERRDAGADALLELARLIGQSDPFAPEGAKSASMPAAGVADGRLASVSRTVAAQHQPPAATRDPFVPPVPDGPYDDRSRREPDFGEPSVPVPPAPPEADDGPDFLRMPADRNGYPVAPRHGADEREFERGGRRQQAAYGHPGEYAEDEYAEGEYGMEPDDYDDDEPPSRRRRPGVVLTVLGLAVFGSAAAYGYRTVFNGAPPGPAPVILADKSPTKTTPLTDTRQESGRAGGVGERLERRDEEPVDLSTYRGLPGSGQFPQDAAGGIPANPNIMPTTPGAVAPQADSKRVRTVPISVDSGTSSRNQPRGVAVPVQTPAQSQASQSQAAQSQAAQSQAAQVPPPSRPAVAPPPPQRQAALAPAPAPAADSAAASPAVESGGYVVQVSAVRSEADAQAAFSRLQTKYPVLSGHQPLIRRKDQGDKGIFFAAQVGPFGAKSEADQLCDQLKSAGGSCYVLRN
jgi:cell division septation protein DedD